MSHRRTLRLFDELLEAAERRRGDDVVVLPVVHDALGPEEQLLAALTDAFDGVYVRADREEPGARGPINPQFARVVRHTFERARLPLQFSESNGKVIATFDDHADPTGGLATALRTAEVLVSSEIDCPLTVMSYSLDGLDDAVAAVLWELSGLAIQDNAPVALRVFIPVAAGEVNADRHCSPNNPVRFAVRQDRILRRGDARALDDAIRDMVYAVDQPLVLFLGAGASVSAGMRLGDAMRDEALSEVVGDHPTLDRRIRAFREYLDEKDRWLQNEKDLPADVFARQLTLERVLREAFHKLAGRSRTYLPVIKRLQDECATALERTPVGRKALWSIAQKLPRLVIVTVNFDELIEDDMPAEHAVLFRPEDFDAYRGLVIDRLNGNSGILPILKIHGSICDVSTLVADIETTERGLDARVAATLDAMVDAVDRALPWTWVGCSMRDVDVRMWLQQKHGVDDLHEWWVDPLPSESLFAYARWTRERQWAANEQKLDDHLITEKADVFLQHLNEHIDALGTSRG